MVPSTAEAGRACPHVSQHGLYLYIDQIALPARTAWPSRSAPTQNEQIARPDAPIRPRLPCHPAHPCLPTPRAAPGRPLPAPWSASQHRMATHVATTPPPALPGPAIPALPRMAGSSATRLRTHPRAFPHAPTRPGAHTGPPTGVSATCEVGLAPSPMTCGIRNAIYFVAVGRDQPPRCMRIMHAPNPAPTNRPVVKPMMSSSTLMGSPLIPGRSAAPTCPGPRREAPR